MARIRADGVSGSLSQDLVQSGPGSDTMKSPGLVDLPSVTGSDRAVISIDPFRVSGSRENVYVFSHAAGSDTALILRGQDGTSARAWTASTVFVHGPVSSDFTDFQSQLDNQFQKTIADAKGDALVATADNIVDNFPVGANYQAWTADSAQTFGVQYRAIPFLCTSSGRPSDGAVFVGMHIFETDSGHTLACVSIGPIVWQYVDAVPGTIVWDAAASLPVGWLWADGAAVSRTTYGGLFARIGTVHGVGNGTTTFTLPSCTDRFVFGVGANALGATGGASTKVVAIANLPSHDHLGLTTFAGGHAHSGSALAAGSHNHGGSTLSDGGHFHTAWVGETNQTGSTSHQHSFVAQRLAMAITGGSNNPSPGDRNSTMSAPVNVASIAAHNHDIPTQGNHTHTLDINPVAHHQHTVQAQGDAVPLNVMPPYVVLRARIRI